MTRPAGSRSPRSYQDNHILKRTVVRELAGERERSDSMRAVFLQGGRQLEGTALEVRGARPGGGPDWLQGGRRVR